MGKTLVILSAVVFVTVAGPVSKQDCSIVKCAQPTCPGLYLPKGQCCATCPDCSAIACPAIVCLGGYVAEGQCCQTCPDCSTVKCGLPDCKDFYTPEGECCATCPGVITEPDCSRIKCPSPNCQNPTKLPGQCCDTCPGDFPGKRCRYDGKTYLSGQVFPDIDGCNTCLCNNGLISCTDKDCPVHPRPGQCPVSTGVGSCVQECFRDYECPVEGDKCCKNGCGYVCLKPVLDGPIPCLYNGVLYQSGASVPSEDCNECTCQEGRIICTEKACPEPVLCPYGTPPEYPDNTCGTIVGLTCNLPNTECRGKGDFPDAGGSCCYINPPIDCNLVDCLPVTCERPKPPGPGECCETCPSDEDCSAVSCLKPICKGNEKLVTPKGECCPVCVPSVPDCSTVLCALPKCKENQKLETPKGKCCPICVPKVRGRPCWYEGTRYNSGNIFPASDNCNTCNCDNGVVHCTEKACVACPYGATGKCNADSPCREPNTECRYGNPDLAPGDGECCYIDDPTIVKPGVCPPPPIEIGICVVPDDYCTSDMACAGTLKCCPNGCSRECLEPVKPSPCKYNGNIYEDGDSFPSTDGCNTCFCSNGAVGCTKRACIGCTYGGNTYASGESFPAGDGCNTCACFDGLVRCTLIACLDTV